MATTHNPEKGRPKLDCQAWEAMLADALDGTLEARDAAVFTAHSQSCAGCGELLEEAKRGSEWLRFLRETPEAPEGLLEKILIGTTGTAEIQPLVSAGVVALPRQPWLGVPLGLLQRHIAESRILMTLAMAFFSIALTLNLTGVHLNQLKLTDLSPATLASSVSRQYFSASKGFMHYYSNLRFVYEVQSRFNEMRHDNNQPAVQPVTQQQPEKTQPTPQPSGKPGGSARRGSALPTGADRSPDPGIARPAPSHYRAGEPVLAAYPNDSHALPGLQPQALVCVRSITRLMGPSPHLMPYPGECHKPTERSLV